MLKWVSLSVSICPLLTFYILNSRRTTEPNWTKLECDTPWMILDQNCVVILADIHSSYNGFQLVEKLEICQSFRTTEWIETKFGPIVVGWFPFKILSPNKSSKKTDYVSFIKLIRVGVGWKKENHMDFRLSTSMSPTLLEA